MGFADLVRMVGEGIADAQRRLDQSSAALISELAEAKVDIVTTITETVAADGTVKTETGPPRTVSLLELGLLPTFYQFSETTVEVVMDLKLQETNETTSSGKERVKGLFAGTRDVRTERKLSRDVTVSSKLTATLVPVPAPIRLEPLRRVTEP